MKTDKPTTNPSEKLPDSELCVMQVIWNSKEPIGTGKIIEILSKEKNWSRSTIQVFLARLEDRGFIDFQKKGRLKYYVPLVEEQVYRAKETETFLEQFYKNSYKNLIASLVQNNTINEEDIEDIIHIIKKGGEKND